MLCLSVHETSTVKQTLCHIPDTEMHIIQYICHHNTSDRYQGQMLILGIYFLFCLGLDREKGLNHARQNTITKTFQGKNKGKKGLLPKLFI